MRKNHIKEKAVKEVKTRPEETRRDVPAPHLACEDKQIADIERTFTPGYEW